MMDNNERRSSFPPAPADIDWASLGLTNMPKVNGHVEVHYSQRTQTWTTPRLVEDPYVRVHGLSSGLNYGQQVYEGLKAFRTAQNSIHIFRPLDHAARLRHSAGMVLLPEVSDDLFLEAVRMAVASNAEFVPPAGGTGFMYIRPVLFGSGPSMAPAPPEDFILSIFVAPAGTSYYAGFKGIDAVVLDDFDRSAPRGTGSGKLGGNYAPVWPHQALAQKSGYAITLHLDSETRTFIEEFSTSGFIGVIPGGPDGKQNKLYVPDSRNAIHSITSDSLVQLAERAGWKVYREPIPCKSLGRFSEVFAVGTGAGAVPVKLITRPTTGERYEYQLDTGGPGIGLAKSLLAIQQGFNAELQQWCWNVTAN